MSEADAAEVVYVNSRYEKSVRDGRRRCHSWFLIDQLGVEHLAVVGLETDTLDGHYVYQALEPFASRMPLNCGNQSGVFKYLERWLHNKVVAAGTAGGGGGAGGAAAAVAEMVAEDAPTYSGGASSAATGSAAPQARRKAFTNSLCSSRGAVLYVAGSSPVHHHGGGSGGSGKAKHKSKHAAAAGGYSTGGSGKHKSVGIVQQNQIKKAKKVQDDIRAEHERLVANHLARLKRGAAAEVQADNNAKQLVYTWLQGELTADELDALEHWRSLLAAVLDLRQQQPQQQPQGSQKQPHEQQQQSEKAVEEQQSGDGDDSSSNQQQQQPEQQSGPQEQQQQPMKVDQQVATTEQVAPRQTPKKQPQQNGKRDGGGGGGGSAAGPTSPAAAAADGGGAAGAVPPKLLAWLQQPKSRQHYTRVMLECLRELGSVDIPAHALLKHQLVGLVQRCRAEQQPEPVRSLAEMVLNRWRWQLAGHMQVLSQPVYMQDHVALLEEEVAAGMVPLPQLPKHKQVLLNTPLPVLAGAPNSRSTYSPSPHNQHHMYLNPLTQMTAATSSTPHVYDAAAAAAAGFAAYPGFTAEGAAAAAAGYYDPSAAGYGGFNTAVAGGGYFTPMPALSGGEQVSGSTPMASGGGPPSGVGGGQQVLAAADVVAAVYSEVAGAGMPPQGVAAMVGVQPQ